MSEFLIVSVVALGSMFLSFFFLKKQTSKKLVNRRLNQFVPSEAIEMKEVEEIPKISIIKKMIAYFAKVFFGNKFSKRSATLLEQAGSKLKPEEFLVIQILFGLGAFLFSVIVGLHWIIGSIIGIVGFGIPYFYTVYRQKKRMQALSYQLIETLGTMANSLRAGFSFMQAMQLVAKELPDPLGPEFDRVVKEVGFGVPLEDVLESLILRLPNKELEVVIRAILAQRKSGGNLAELMETMEETIRGRIRVLEELNTLTAQGRMSSWIITLLPVALGVYFFKMSPDYFSPMIEHPLGWLLLGMGSISIIIGWFVIQKIIKIEV
jgi:tight adherence protein B